MATPTSPSQTLNFFGVFSESKRIINAHSRHFLALSVLFLLPLSFSLIIYPTLSSIVSHHQSDSITTQILFRHVTTFHHHNYTHTVSLLPILYSVFVLLFSLCAVATITYSTYHGFYGRPVKILSAVKSLLYSFLPLLSTVLAIQIVVFFICVVFGISFALSVRGIESLGFHIDYDSSYSNAIFVVSAVILGLILVYLQVNWGLAPVIVVAESKWGFEPLRRSAYLIRGMRFASLWLFLFFGVLTGFLVWLSSDSVLYSDRACGWKSWAFIIQTVASSGFITLFLLHSTAVNTVLYMYCKALHGELAFEIAEEFGHEYVSLPFDDEKLPHVVTVVHV